MFAIKKDGAIDDVAVSDDEWETLLSFASADRVSLARRLRHGMSTRTLEALDRARTINLALLANHGLLDATAWESAKAQGRTGRALSDLFVRYLRISKIAKRIWDDETAEKWLVRPNSALQGEIPITLLDSDQGAQAVEVLLAQIEHGIPS